MSSVTAIPPPDLRAKRTGATSGIGKRLLCRKSHQKHAQTARNPPYWRQARHPRERSIWLPLSRRGPATRHIRTAKASGLLHFGWIKFLQLAGNWPAGPRRIIQQAEEPVESQRSGSAGSRSIGLRCKPAPRRKQARLSKRPDEVRPRRSTPLYPCMQLPVRPRLNPRNPAPTASIAASRFPSAAGHSRSYPPSSAGRRHGLRQPRRA